MRNGWTSLVDLLFPRTCAGCGMSVMEEGIHLCWDCRRDLAVISAPFCSTCGEPVHGRVDHAYVCHACVKQPMRFDRARAAIHYNALGKKLVTQFKYGHALWLESALVDLLEAGVRNHYGEETYDLLAAVPLHPVKRRERGYNQAALLAARLARRLRVPMSRSRALRRIRMTPSQTRLTAKLRLTNVMGAFEVTRPGEWKGKRVLLVDDVMTTGATVSACAEVIREAGAERVDVITVARGV